MAKAVKLRNELYLDSTSIVHNKVKLNTVLDNINTSITNINIKNTSQDSKILKGFNQCKDYIMMAKNNNSEPLDWPGYVGKWTIFGSMITSKSYGSLLTRSGNYIVVGKNVEKVRVRAKVICQIDSWSANDWLFLCIGKNGANNYDAGTVVAKSIISELNWVTLQCEAIVDVVEGDKFAMYVRNEVDKSFKFYNYIGFGDSPGCFLEVEVLKYSDDYSW